MAAQRPGVPAPRPKAATIVSGFAALPDEFRVWPLLRRLAGEGFRLALPVMQGKGKPLVFRAWAPGDAMDKGVWGIAEPKADKAALEPDILLVPLLAFDRTRLAARLRRRLLRPHARRACARARRWSPSVSPTTSRRSTRCRISTMTSASTGC